MATRLPLPTKVELKTFAEQEKARRRATAERLLQDHAVTLEELIMHGLASEMEMH